MATTWKTVRVFISSTFRDMHAERDHLVRFVFPRLREELLPRRIHLVDVDLRWGVTSEQNALDVCREIIDECRPRFVCVLGGRYGWTPPGKPRSITADEVHYAVLDRAPNHRRFAHFYFRDEAATAAMQETSPGEFRELAGSDSQNQLAELKQAIQDARLNAFTYPAEWDNQSRRLTGLKEFGQRVREDLLQSCKDDPELRDRFVTDAVVPLDEFAEENAAMEAFAEERSKRFVLGSRATVLEDLLAHACASDGDNYICLTGAPGSGKSALVAHLSRHAMLVSQPSTLVIRHFVGASPGSTDVRRTLRRLCHELKAGCPEITAAIPDDPEKVRLALPGFLRQACVPRRVVILLDAVNQFDPASHSDGFEWLPQDLPANARFILSALDGAALEELRCRPRRPREVALQPLTADDGEAIIEQFSKRYRKNFEPDQQAALLAKADASTPLYLLAALEELRTLGAFEEISHRIAELPPRTDELFAWILQRLEEDDGFRDAQRRPVGNELVPRFAALLGASRHGLSRRELDDLLAPGDAEAEPPVPPDPQGNVAALVHLLRPYLMLRGELLDFYHGQFRQAAMNRYLAEEEARVSVHRGLAAYFRHDCDPGGNGTWTGDSPRAYAELPYHVVAARDYADIQFLVQTDFSFRQAAVLTDVDAMTDARGIAEVLARAAGDSWNDLVRCARTHCALVDRVQARPEALETLARRGDVSAVQAIIESEPDEGRRGLLALAASVLLGEAGHGERAADLRARASGLLRTSEYDLPTRCLVGALLPELPLPGIQRDVWGNIISGAKQDPATQIDVPPAPVPDWNAVPRVPPRQDVPLPFVLAVYLQSDWLVFGLSMGFFWVGIIAWGACMGWWGLLWWAATCLPPIVGLTVGADAGRALLKSKANFVDDTVAGLAWGFHEAPALRKRAILRKAMRFARLLAKARQDPSVWEKWQGTLTAMAREVLRTCETPSQAAECIREILFGENSTALGIIASGLEGRDASFTRAVFLELSEHPCAFARENEDETRRALFKLLLCTCGNDLPPIPLVRFLHGFHERDTHKLIASLRPAAPLCLAMAILAPLGQIPVVRSGLSSFFRRLTNFFLEDTVAPGAPLNRWEPLVKIVLLGSFLLITLVPLFLLFILPLLVALILLMWFWFHVGGRIYDPCGLAGASREGDLDERFRSVGRTLAASDYRGLFPIIFGFRRFSDSVLAYVFLEGGTAEKLGSYGSIRRVLRRLLRHGLLGSGKETILRFMNDRQLLEAVAAIGLKGASEHAPRRLTYRDHEEQLRRVLPISPTGASLLAAGILSFLGAVAVVLISRMLVPAQSAPPLTSRILLPVFAWGCLLVVLQHRLRRIDTAYVLFAFVSMFVMVGFILIARPDPVRVYWISALAVAVPIVSNLLVPELILHWRGSHLLYPRRRTIWLHRFLWTLLAAGGTVALAFLVAGLARLVLSSP